MSAGGGGVWRGANTRLGTGPYVHANVHVAIQGSERYFTYKEMICRPMKQRHTRLNQAPGFFVSEYVIGG